MCNKNSMQLQTTTSSDGASTRRMQTRSMIKKLTQQNNNTNTAKACLSARRTRTKTRKPKYLSLLRLEPPQEISKTTSTQKPQRHKQPRKQQQQQEQQHMHEEKDKILHMHEEKDMHENEDNNVAFLFESSYSSATTLNELLSCNGGETTTTTTEDGFGYNRGRGRECDGACSTLVRTAMKGKERDVNEEKWVVYSEVVEKKDEEVTSCNSSVVVGNNGGNGGLCLKLDYEEILNAWSDKGSLYIEGENQSQSPQTVPDLFPASNSNVLMDGWGSAGNIWRVPDIEGVPDIGGGSFSGLKVNREVGGESFMMGRREASVLRYKEKRQSRLFSKRIRYEVRKLNAEKRPRMKGRFVKRS